MEENKQKVTNVSQSRSGDRGGRGGFSNRPQYRPTGPQGDSEFFEKVVQVNRVSKKTKGGDKRSLSVLVVVGDKKGKVGVGLGKAADVQSAVRKATAYAKKHLISVPMVEGRTIPHPIWVKLGAAKVLMKPAREGTGVIAGGPVRVVVEAAGIRDVVSKILGTKNKASNVYVTLRALTLLKPRNGVSQEKIMEETPGPAAPVSQVRPRSKPSLRSTPEISPARHPSVPKSVKEGKK